LEEDFNYWDITFDGEDPGTADDFVLSFIDCSFLVGEPLLTNEFMDDLILLIKKHENYNIIGNIKEIVDDIGEIQSDKNIYAMLGILHNGLRVGFLLGNLIDNDKDYWHIAAIWPQQFAQKVVENQEIFHKALLMFVDKPDEWLRVDLIVPISKKTRNINLHM
jgi:hypothetical protein